MPKTEDYYKGKTIVITGAGSGIGRATAKVFGREGANVVSTDIDVEAAERTANEVIQIGAEATFVKCDVTARAEVDAAVRQAEAAVRSGRGVLGAFEDQDLGDWL